MSVDRKTQIIRAFDRAEHYDSHAHVQKIVAQRLAQRIAGLDIDLALPAWEIGCGTGFLTEAILERRPDLKLTISDIAPAMVDRVRLRIGEKPTLRYATIDGEQPEVAPDGGYGLIASSLAFQWFDDLQLSIARFQAMLAPGGWLVFTTLAAGTFVEWRTAERDAGRTISTRDYPTADAMRASCPENCGMEINIYPLTAVHPDGMAFLRGLKAIGADTAWQSAEPQPSKSLRKAVALLEHSHENGVQVTYEIAEVVVRRK